jgi:hypothetical protein
MGAKVGVGIGSVGLAAIAGVIIWLIFQKRNAQQAPCPLFYDQQSMKATFEGKDPYVHELPASSQKSFATELPSCPSS